MKSKLIAQLFAPLVLAASALPAFADTAQAECEFRRDGDYREKHSGPCEFSQRQGFITIRLQSGKTFELKPGERAHRYHDQNGEKVRLRDAGADSSTYQWDNKSITVYWNRGGQGGGESYQGNVPPSLQDMMGASARNMDSELQRRNYAYRNGWTDGDTKYSAWQEQENGNCVAVGVSGGRIVAIDNVSADECRGGSGSQGGGGTQGNVPPSLKDMMGAPARNMDSELQRRNYAYRNGWTDGDTKYSAWQEQENGTCVAVAVNGGRIIAIDYVDQNECRR